MLTPLSSLADYASPGIDQFLARSLATASTDVKNALGILSCLPARGVPLPLLAGLLKKTQAVTRSILLSSQSSSAIIIDGDLVRFAHDRIQQAASNLVQAKEAPRVHFEIAQHLRMAGSEYLFDAVDNFLRARSLGQQMEDIEELALFGSSFLLSPHPPTRANQCSLLQPAKPPNAPCEQPPLALPSPTSQPPRNSSTSTRSRRGKPSEICACTLLGRSRKPAPLLGRGERLSQG